MCLTEDDDVPRTASESGSKPYHLYYTLHRVLKVDIQRLDNVAAAAILFVGIAWIAKSEFGCHSLVVEAVAYTADRSCVCLASPAHA